MMSRFKIYTNPNGSGASYPNEKEAIRHATWLSQKTGERVFIRDGIRTIGSVLASRASEFQYDTMKERETP